LLGLKWASTAADKPLNEGLFEARHSLPMIQPVARSAAAHPVAATPRRPASLDAALSTARAKLNDWVTCPSAKTPEGKHQVKKATDELAQVQAQIKRAEDPQGQTAGAINNDGSSQPAGHARQDLQNQASGGVYGLSGAGRAELNASSWFGTPARLGSQLNVVA
jgi:hypothetical protein